MTRANLRPTAADRLPGWKPGTDLSGLPPQVRDLTSGDLAPDGRHWFTAEGNDPDQFEVFDSATGEQQDPSYRTPRVAFPRRTSGSATTPSRPGRCGTHWTGPR